jgi:hypothetical protein
VTGWDTPAPSSKDGPAPEGALRWRRGRPCRGAEDGSETVPWCGWIAGLGVPVIPEQGRESGVPAVLTHGGVLADVKVIAKAVCVPHLK